MIILAILLTLLIAPHSWASVTCTGDTQWLSSTTVPVTGPPFTISVWFKSANAAARAASDSLVFLGNSGTTGDWFSTGIFRSGVSRMGAWHRVGGDTDGEASPSVGTIIDATWQHVLASYDSNSQRSIRVDDANPGDNVVEQGAVTINTFAICRLNDSSPSNYWNGQVAEIAIWNGSLSAANKTSLAGGANPMAINPGNLARYCTLASDATCTVGPNLTNNGSATFNAGDHPTIDAPPGVSARRRIAPFIFGK